MAGETSVDFGSILDNIEDFSLNVRNYNEIMNILKIEKPITCSDAEKLVSICLQDINDENKKYSFNSLNILSVFLSKIKKKQCSSTTNIVLSALGILCTLKTISSLHNIQSLISLCFEILLMYPAEVLVTLAVDYEDELYEIVELYCTSQGSTEVSLVPTCLILRFLKIMPQNDKLDFVKNGMDVWFSCLIPSIFEFRNNCDNETVKTAVECLELLTEELIVFDYFDNLKWLDLLKNIYEPNKYPSIMKLLLEHGCDYWHSLWIVCIKLLKNQITKSINSLASPINSMLPVVETAFKMDVKNRCFAFKCWDVLIDNFATEMNEVYMNKRVRLILIPLISNNAKVEEIALVKFNTWWHFIVKFHTKIPKLSDMVLLPFLQFCFGKPSSSNKSSIIPGLFSEDTKKLSVQCFTNIFAHYKCAGCTDLEKLESRLMTTTHLVTNWKDWIHSLSVVITIASDIGDNTLKQQVRCAWKSFVATVGELPENNIRRDLFIEFLAMLQKLLQSCQVETSDIVINVLLPALFEDDEHIKPLLKISSDQSAILKIFSMFIDPSNNNFYSRCNVDETIKSIKSSTDHLVQVSLKTSSFVMETIIKDMQTTESSLILWTAIVESTLKYEYISCTRMICNIILWPLKINFVTNIKKYISTWQTIYDYASSKMVTSVNDEILQFFAINKDINTIFSLTAILSVMGQILLKDEETKFDKKSEVILKLLLKQIDDHKQIQAVYLQLLQCVATLLNRLTKSINVTCTKHLLCIINKIFKVAPNIINKDLKETKEIDTCINTIILTTDKILKMDDYCKFNSIILEGIKKSASYFLKITNNKNCILSILSTYEIKDSEIKNLIELFTVNEDKSEEKQTVDYSFSTPNKNLNKKTTKKEASIVNTVLENGEEFVVVKSNWKFNPKKLTDNQKEKLQRKREDIPALYQDLSQSQDEFKLTAWKTESNDANSSSKSTSVSVSDVVLKNIPNSEIMPKIMDNITKTDDKEPSTAEKTNIENIIASSNNSTPNSLQATVTKSPRMALKDRVFRNVRNLIEKSNLTKKDFVCSANISENGSKTPSGVKTVINTNIINSAPSQLNCDRPTRVKRPPKKFVDSEIISMKRKRSSVGQRDAQLNSEKLDRVNSNDETTNSDKNVSRAYVFKENLEIPLKSNIDNCNNEQIVHCEPVTNTTTEIGKHTTDDSKLIINKDTPASSVDHVKEVMDDTDVKDKEEISLNENHINTTVSKTQTAETKNENAIPKSLTKKNVSKKSRIEKELAIDMVDGHPFLNAQPEKRLTRKSISNSLSSRKKVTPKSVKNKTKVETKMSQTVDKFPENGANASVSETQLSTIDIAGSQDIIESSQDSTVTTISVGSTKKNSKKVPSVAQNTIAGNKIGERDTDVTASSLGSKKLCNLDINTEVRDDSVFPQNKTAEGQSALIDLTKDIDTQPNDQSKTTEEQRILIELTDNMDTQPDDQRKTMEEQSISIELTENMDTQPNDQSKTTEEQSILIELTDNMDTQPDDQRKTTEEQSISIELTENMDTQPIDQSKTTEEQSILIELTDNMDTQPDDQRKTTEEQSISIELTENMDTQPNDQSKTTEEQSIFIESSENMDTQPNDQNKTTEEQNALNELTENMDTQPVEINDVFKIGDMTQKQSVEIKIKDSSMEIDSQNTANADTQSCDPNLDLDNIDTMKSNKSENCGKIIGESDTSVMNHNDTAEASTPTSNKTTPTPTTVDISKRESEPEEAASSPFEDDERRRKDFLDDTSEISPIKRSSPVRDDPTPSPETGDDDVVIELSPTERSDGEATEKCVSPEIFTEEKMSPDKRDSSPPREEAAGGPGGAGPRVGGRGARMLGLCVRAALRVGPARAAPDAEHAKRPTALHTSARRNLRILYNSTESHDASDDEDGGKFLEFKRNLPKTDCSPSGPILKRKLVDIIDDATPSPSSKRKRVSFHDPPVSTTVCVNKYIEPCAARSPQSSANKRQERQLRSQNQTPKSQRRLDKALTKTIESFVTENSSEDTPISSLEQTPVIEVVKTSDLNDTDPIYPQLVDCKDPIENIATELSSPAMKTLLVQEFEGKIETVGDLAKKTELEVHRLCVKAPKVQTVKNVLNNYLPKRNAITTNEIIANKEAIVVNEDELNTSNAERLEENKAEVVTANVQIQTDILDVSSNSSQTDSMAHSNSSVQTDMGKMIYEHDIPAHLSGKPDILKELDDNVLATFTDTFVERLPASKSCEIIDRIVERQCGGTESKDGRFSFLQKYLCDKFESRDLMLFCSGLLKKAYAKS